ncbi:hypothetical protein M427DRAFT_438166 [Gonapodya prolifera JEL478]|uniref:Uncharacterized protein n=1 Tax=Gonapodya prolifera (strain JEL478) TaxID=1344416 RepID=A0A139A3H2_GONPJ|nr:hypothetical protein M427DRAFT_438166 [Gonapodya prolifera JEL478]|eukprot:KXS11320.1 hypothetical protein M427DRAFT_438166 [Gonapodya prolifera JEL478]
MCFSGLVAGRRRSWSTWRARAWAGSSSRSRRVHATRIRVNVPLVGRGCSLRLRNGGMTVPNGYSRLASRTSQSPRPRQTPRPDATTASARLITEEIEKVALRVADEIVKMVEEKVWAEVELKRYVARDLPTLAYQRITRNMQFKIQEISALAFETLPEMTDVPPFG